MKQVQLIDGKVCVDHIHMYVAIPPYSKLATPISNGGLDFTPPGIITGSARGGISQYHYFWLPSYVGLATFFRPLVYHLGFM